MQKYDTLETLFKEARKRLEELMNSMALLE